MAPKRRIQCDNWLYIFLSPSLLCYNFIFSSIFATQVPQETFCTQRELYVKNNLIHVFSTASCRTRAGNFHVLDGEFVVIGQFFTGNDSSLSKNDDVFFAENVHDFRVTIGLEMIRKTGQKFRKVIMSKMANWLNTKK